MYEFAIVFLVLLLFFFVGGGWVVVVVLFSKFRSLNLGEGTILVWLRELRIFRFFTLYELVSAFGPFF